ncbi:GNAT family N-acetyltransferase [Vibrio chagasii]|nr:GNAT family N-acetyltransferase [Vibrio chagasii]
MRTGELIACARLLPPGTTYGNASIGRVATKQSARGNGLGHKLLVEALTRCEHYGQHDHRYWCTEHLESFYASHGFKTI